VKRLLEFAPRVVALGGGGYDLPNVARAWTAAWAALNDVVLPEALPRRAQKEFARYGLQTPTLSDPPVELPGDARRWAEEYARRQVAAIQEKIFPLHGL
jgi:acetoin utilization protein AcuC